MEAKKDGFLIGLGSVRRTIGFFALMVEAAFILALFFRTNGSQKPWLVFTFFLFLWLLLSLASKIGMMLNQTKILINLASFLAFVITGIVSAFYPFPVDSGTVGLNFMAVVMVLIIVVDLIDILLQVVLSSGKNN